MKYTTNKYYAEITSKHNLFDLNLKEVWRYRDLITLFTKRTFTLTYKQTILGPAWIFLNPLISSIIYAFVFGGIAGQRTGKTSLRVLQRFRQNYSDRRLQLYGSQRLYCTMQVFCRCKNSFNNCCILIRSSNIGFRLLCKIQRNCQRFIWHI